MATYYGTERPTIVMVVSWDGDNIDEIKERFGPDLAPYFFINEENNNLCYGLTVDDANQYPVGTLLSSMGGVSTVEPQYWDVTYQMVDTPDRMKYTLVEDAVPSTLASRNTKRS